MKGDAMKHLVKAKQLFVSISKAGTKTRAYKVTKHTVTRIG